MWAQFQSISQNEHGLSRSIFWSLLPLKQALSEESGDGEKIINEMGHGIYALFFDSVYHRTTPLYWAFVKPLNIYVITDFIA